MLYTFIQNFDDVRYADELSIGHEVLMRENGQLEAIKVKKISNFIMQGNFQWNKYILSRYLNTGAVLDQWLS